MQLRQTVLNFGQHSEMFLPSLELCLDVDQTFFECLALLRKLQVLHFCGSLRTIQPNDIFKKQLILFSKQKSWMQIDTHIL